MPKIVIKEYDKTTTGNTAYNNFAVVVPGFRGTPKDGISTIDADKKFDDNGIYECASQSDFINYIGKRAAETVVEDDLTALASPAIAPKGNKVTITAETFAEKKATGKLYTFTANNTGEIGKLKSEAHIYTKVAENDTFNEHADYATIEPGNEGADAVYGKKVTKMQMGNQIAYELLGLGYTVLFKQLEDLSELSNANWWEPLKDKATYDFRYIVNGLICGIADENKVISDLATARGDIIALVDVDLNDYIDVTPLEAIQSIKNSKSISGDKNTAIFAPVVYYNFVDKDYCPDATMPTQFPASFHYLACAANAAESYNEWYAIAGYTRGVSKYTIAGVAKKFGEAAIEALEPRTDATGTNKAINLVVQIKKAYYLWGNRTAKSLDANGLIASHFLNIRQLCITIKKQVYVACRQCTFDPNSDLLWINFCSKIRPTLEKMKGDQGISDYKFIKVKNAQKATLTAIIRIVPIEAVEDFDISIYLEDSIGGNVIGIEEVEKA